MGTALILSAPRTFAFATEPDPALAPSQLRLRTLFSGISAGTEMTYYRGTNPYLTKRWDAARRLFVAAAAEAPAYPVTHLGYEEVGEVVETGSAVRGVPPGTLVFGTWGHRTRHVAEWDYVQPRLLPAGVDPLYGIFSHLGAIALNGVHDAGARVGETAAVFGLGALGQLVCLLLQKAGVRVIGVDLQAARRELAKRLGADAALDPGAGSAAEAIKSLTQGRGADVVVEVSGAAPALQEAIRSVVYAGKVVVMGFFQGEARGLFLGEEFHHNRVQLVCSQISGVAPDRSNRWDKLRLWQTAVRLQAEGQIDFRPVISHRAPFREAPALFEEIDRHPEQVVHGVLDLRGET